MALLLVEEFLKDLGKGMLLTKSTLNVVFYIASWWLSVNVADWGLQICQVRGF